MVPLQAIDGTYLARTGPALVEVEQAGIHPDSDRKSNSNPRGKWWKLQGLERDFAKGNIC